MEAQTLPSLRPLRLGELLDQAIRLYRRNFLTFVSIIAVVIVPIKVLQAIATVILSNSMLDLSSASSLEQFFLNSGYWIGIGSIVVLIFVQFFLVQGIAAGALARAIGDNYLGKKTGILDAYQGINKSWSSLLGSLLSFGIFLILAIAWWVIVPCVGWFTGFGLIAFILGATLPIIVPVVVLEASGPWSSPSDNIFKRFINWIVRSLSVVHRAWNLSRRRFWPLLGYIFVLYLFSFIIIKGPTGIVSVVLTKVVDSFDDTTKVIISTIVQSLVDLITTLIYYPLQMSAFTLIYFDLRVRTEGFDIALSALQMDTTNEKHLMPAPPSTTNERFITGADLGNFAILTLGAAGVYILLFALIMGVALIAASLF